VFPAVFGTSNFDDFRVFVALLTEKIGSKIQIFIEKVFKRRNGTVAKPSHPYGDAQHIKINRVG